MKVRFFVPSTPTSLDIESVLRGVGQSKSLNPFDPELVDFVADFAKSILLDKYARAFPELIVLANFFKSGNIVKLKNELYSHGSSLCVARGLVFHLAPSNVDSIFLYSSLLSLLCGNVNVIRISRSAGAQIGFILDKLRHLLEARYVGISDRFFVITYEHDDAVTSLISMYCHMRVVWGGDATVKKIRSLPLRPTASEICFPDRFSAAMLNVDAVLDLEQADLLNLCSKFFNDSIWFSQQACSSPRLVSWIGNPTNCATARKRFWQAFDLQLQQKEYENSAGMVMDRFVTACMVATDALHNETSALSFPTRILLNCEPLAAVKDYHCGNGLFYEQCFSAVSEFFQTLTDREQTLSVFGFEAQEIQQSLHHLPMRALDRVTNIGHALDFGHIWDGYDLLHAFTRKISISL